MNIGFISLGSSGTMGHFSLIKNILANLKSAEHKLFVISEYDYKNYGNGIILPNKHSDIDLIVLDSAELRDKIKHTHNNSAYYFSQIDKNYFDIVCMNVLIDDTRVSFNIFSTERYLKLCCEGNKEIVVFKDLKNKVVGSEASAPYYVSSLNQDFWIKYKITVFEEGHKIICPNIDSSIFTINSFQEEIITQTEITDYQNILSQGRNMLTNKIIAKAKTLNTSPLGLHRIKMPFWSDEFIKLMRDRYDV